MGEFESRVQNAMNVQDVEKSFIDKLIARRDIESIKKLIKKPDLTREELLEITYNLSSSELKLVNLSEWDRYVILKFGGVWIGQFVKMAELLYDYKEYLDEKETLLIEKLQIKHPDIQALKGMKPLEVRAYSDKYRKDLPKEFINDFDNVCVSRESRMMLHRIELLIEHTSKMLSNLFFMIIRSSLSIGASGFLELLKNKFEMVYQGTPPATPTVEKAATIRR